MTYILINIVSMIHHSRAILFRCCSTLMLLSATFSAVSQTVFNTEQDSLVELISTRTGVHRVEAIQDFSERYSGSHPEQVIKYTDEGILLSRKLDAFKMEADLYRLQGMAYTTLQDMDAAATSLAHASTKALQLRDTLLYTQNSLALGKLQESSGNHSAAFEYYSIAHTWASAMKDPLLTYSVNTHIGISYREQGKHIKALEIFEANTALCRSARLNCNGNAINRAISLRNLGKPSEALKIFLDALREAEATKNILQTVSINHHIAHILQNIGLTEEALPYYSKVLTFFETHEEIKEVADVNEILGVLMIDLHRYEEAWKYLQKALIQKKENGLKTYANTLRNLGVVNFRRGMYTDVETFYKIAEKTYEENENQEGLVAVYANFVEFYLKAENYDTALKYAEKGAALSTMLQLQSERAVAYLEMSTIYEHQKRYAESVAARKTYEMANVDVGDRSAGIAIMQQLARKQLFENTSKISVLTEQLEEKKKTTISSHWWWSILPIILAIIVFIRFKNQKKGHVSVPSEILDQNEAQRLEKLLVYNMQEERPYLNEDLTLRDLADLLPTTQKKLSMLLNQHLKTNFYDYINKYRVAAFMAELKEERNEQYSIVGIASDCGFKSKSSFYRIFKKETGISPGEYKKQESI